MKICVKGSSANVRGGEKADEKGEECGSELESWLTCWMLPCHLMKGDDTGGRSGDDALGEGEHMSGEMITRKRERK